MAADIEQWLEDQCELLYDLNERRMANQISGSCSVPIRQHYNEYRALKLAVDSLKAYESEHLPLVLNAISDAMRADETYDWRISGHHDESEPSDDRD